MLHPNSIHFVRKFSTSQVSKQQLPGIQHKRKENTLNLKKKTNCSRDPILSRMEQLRDDLDLTKMERFSSENLEAVFGGFHAFRDFHLRQI